MLCEVREEITLSLIFHKRELELGIQWDEGERELNLEI